MYITKENYAQHVSQTAPTSETAANAIKAFVSGGILCSLSQGLTNLYITYLQMPQQDASTLTSVTLVFLAILLTGLGIFDVISRFCGAGVIVPITGFANSMASPAMEFKTEGLVTGLGVKMFTVAGPVLVYGISTSIIAGVIAWLL